MSFNKVILLGNLTRDPEMKNLSSSSITDFSIAVNRKFKKGDGSDGEEVAFIDCKAWGKTGETITKFFGKGKPILVEGRMTQDQWKDKDTGANRSKLVVTVESFSFVGGEKREDKPATQSYNRPAQNHGNPLDESDIPF